MPEFLTIDQVCELLCISRRTLERFRRDNDAPSHCGCDNCRCGEQCQCTPESNCGCDCATRVAFLAPTFYIGRSPRWEKAALIDFLKTHGRNLSDSVSAD